MFDCQPVQQNDHDGSSRNHDACFGVQRFWSVYKDHPNAVASQSHRLNGKFIFNCRVLHRSFCSQILQIDIKCHRHQFMITLGDEDFLLTDQRCKTWFFISMFLRVFNFSIFDNCSHLKFNGKSLHKRELAVMPIYQVVDPVTLSLLSEDSTICYMVESLETKAEASGQTAMFTWWKWDQVS